MRRRLFWVLFMLLVISLVACSSKTNIITDAVLTERENMILSATANQSFVYDFKVDDHLKEVDIWVEKYELGTFVKEINHISTEVNQKGTIIFTTSHPTEENNQSLFTVSIDSDGATSTGWSQETVAMDLSALWASSPLNNMPITGKMTLASICYSSKDEIPSLTTEFFNDAEKHKSELKKFDVVYLLKSEFR